MGTPIWFFIAFGAAVVAILVVSVVRNGKIKNGGSGTSSRADDPETDKLCRELSAEELFEKANALVQDNGLKSDYNRWEKFMCASADKGYIPAVREWGSHNRNKNTAVALQYLTRAAEAGDGKAAEELYKLFRYGSHHGTTSVNADKKRAFTAMMPLAEKGMAVPQRLVADYFYFDEDDDKKALEWYLKAAEGGDAEAMTQAAEIYFFQDEEDEQIKWLMKAAEQNYAEAEAELGSYYYCDDEPDFAKAMEWYKRASEHGNSTASCRVGEMYLKGEGVEKDEKQAFGYFKKAYEKGSVYGEYLVGKCYFDGTGVVQDKGKAIKHITEAAKYDRDAQYKLGECYYNGYGVKADKEKAKDFWRKAAKYGNKDAAECLKIYFGETA